jgi:hypothetical protein
VSRLRYLNPFLIRRALRDARRALSGGGPAAVRVVRIGRPRGILLPNSRIDFEVIARDESTNRFTTVVPLPWPYAWSYRLARALHLPLIRRLDPERVRFKLPIPRP